MASVLDNSQQYDAASAVLDCVRGCFVDDDGEIAGFRLIESQTARDFAGGAARVGCLGALVYGNEKLGVQTSPESRIFA